MVKKQCFNWLINRKQQNAIKIEFYEIESMGKKWLINKRQIKLFASYIFNGWSSLKCRTCIIVV